MRHAPNEGPLPDSQESPTETQVQKMVSYWSLCPRWLIIGDSDQKWEMVFNSQFFTIQLLH